MKAKLLPSTPLHAHELIELSTTLNSAKGSWFETDITPEELVLLNADLLYALQPGRNYQAAVGAEGRVLIRAVPDALRASAVGYYDSAASVPEWLKGDPRVIVAHPLSRTSTARAALHPLYLEWAKTRTSSPLSRTAFLRELRDLGYADAKIAGNWRMRGIEIGAPDPLDP